MATFTNQATLAYNSKVTSSNIVTGEIVEGITVSKTAVSENYASGEDLTYVISIINSDATSFTGLTVSDNLGAYSFGEETLVPLTYIANSVKLFIDGVLQASPTVSCTNPLEFTGISIPSGASAILVYEVSVNEFAPLDVGATITNTASVSGGGLTNPVTAEATVTVSEEPELTISKSINPSTVTENSQVTYTFTIQNYGNTEATADDNAVVTDTFNPALSNIVVTFDSASWAKTTDYTYDEATGLFSTVAGRITVPPATFTQDEQSGAYSIIPGESVLTVTGTI